MTVTNIKECKNYFHLKAIEKWTQTCAGPVCRISSDCKQFFSKASLGEFRNVANVTNGMVWGFQYIGSRETIYVAKIFGVNTCCSSRNTCSFSSIGYSDWSVQSSSLGRSFNSTTEIILHIMYLISLQQFTFASISGGSLLFSK